MGLSVQGIESVGVDTDAWTV